MFSWRKLGRDESAAIQNCHSGIPLGILSTLIPDPHIQAALEALTTNSGSSKSDCDERSAGARTLVRQPNPTVHPNESQRFCAFVPDVLEQDMGALGTVRASIVAVALGRHQVFTGPSLTVESAYPVKNVSNYYALERERL